MPSFIIGFKKTNSASTKAPTEAMDDNLTHYFQYEADTAPDAGTIKYIVYYMTQAYPDIASFPDSLDSSRLVFDANDFYSRDRNQYLNYFLVKSGDFYEIHSKINTPTLYTMKGMRAPTVKEFKTDEESDDNACHVDIKSLLNVFPLHEFTTFTRISIPEAVQFENQYNVTVDENLIPAKKLLDANAIQVKTNQSTFAAIQRLYLEVKTSLVDTQAISSTAMTETKPYDGELEELIVEINEQVARAAELNTTAATLDQKLLDQYNTLMEDDAKFIEWRHTLIMSLWACALFSAQGNINFNAPTAESLTKFNFQFAKIATIKTINSKATLVFDYNLQHLSFTQLQDLTNTMLSRFYQKGGITLYLGYNWSSQIEYFAKIILQQLYNFADMNIKTNTFNWVWRRLHTDAGVFNRTALAENTQQRDALEIQSEILDNLLLRLTTMKQAVTEINTKNKAMQKKLGQNEQSISGNATSAKSATRSMNDDYLQANQQLQTLQQVLNELLLISAKFTLPFAAMEELITQAERVQTKMEANLVIAGKHASDLFISASIAQKVQIQATLISDKQIQFAKNTQPLTELNGMVASIKRIMTEQQPVINSKDNLIVITRKFANMLADVEYFHSLVSWGGTKVLVNDTSYAVPKSFSELLNLRNSLTDPMRFEDASTFWTEAKKIATLAEKRTSYRYFFIFYKKVRSPEMEALLKLIKDLDIDNIPTPDHIDTQLSDIKPNWREDQRSSKISIRVDVASRPRLPVSDLRNLSLTSSFNRAESDDSPVDDSPVDDSPRVSPSRSRRLVV